MTRRILVSIAGVCVLAAGALLAQTGGTLKANIPFEFTFGNARMPAGDYVIGKAASGGILLVSKDQKVRKIVLGVPMEIQNRREAARLVFRRYGSETFLAQVWTREQQWACEIPTSKLEREVIARSQRPNETEQVAVSAQ